MTRNQKTTIPNQKSAINEMAQELYSVHIMNTVAIPVWNGLVSPVFDSAASVLIIPAEGQRETIAMGNLGAAEKVQELSNYGVTVLICGAISNYPLALLTQKDIRVIPWVRGNIEEVYRALCEERLLAPRFLMPGCSRNAYRCRMRRGRGWRRRMQGRGGNI